MLIGDQQQVNGGIQEATLAMQVRLHDKMSQTTP